MYLDKVIINQREKDIVISYWTSSWPFSGRMKVPGTLKKVPPEELWRRIFSNIDIKVHQKIRKHPQMEITY
jgi:hypothetical protein